MLLMTLGYNYPLSFFTPPHSSSFLSTPVIYTRGHPLSCFAAAIGTVLIRNSMEGRQEEDTWNRIF